MTKVLRRLLFSGPPHGNWDVEAGLFILRVWTGFALAFGHGLSKLPPSDQFIAGTADMGFPLPTASAWMGALGEFLGGILLALGLMTRPAALWILCVMGTAAFVAHANDPWFAAVPSKEMALLFFAPALCFLFAGSGRTGVDRFLRP